VTSSAQRKLARGIKHVQTLRAEASAFEDGEAYVFSVESETRSSQEIAYQWFATEHHSPCDDWPLLAGEAIQNLRSALDHVVWRAWRDAGNPGIGDHTQFPVAIDAPGFRSQAGYMLQGIPQPIRTLIEEAQPYKRTPQTPARDALQLLRTLSNIDKHRDLAAVASAATLRSIGSWGERIYYAFDKFAPYMPLGHGKTEIYSFSARSVAEIEEMNVHPHFTYEVRIEGMPLDVLIVIARRVFEVVTEIETGQPPPPFSPYPI